jgi:hypothetical protein
MMLLHLLPGLFGTLLRSGLTVRLLVLVGGVLGLVLVLVPVLVLVLVRGVGHPSVSRQSTIPLMPAVEVVLPCESCRARDVQ